MDEGVPQRDAYLWIFGISLRKNRLRCLTVSELKCCRRCGAFITCDHKGECCVECDYFDPIDVLCMAGPEKKAKPQKDATQSEVDPETFLFEEDDEEEELDNLPPEREADDDEEEDEDLDEDEDFEMDEDDDW